MANFDIYTNLSGYVKRLSASAIGAEEPKMTMERVDENLSRINFCYTLPKKIKQDDCFAELETAFNPNFFWTPHLTPSSGNIAAEHIFRTPALIARGEGKTLILIPDIESKKTPAKYLDLDAPNRCMKVGMSNSRVIGHVLYERAEGGEYSNGNIVFSFHIMTFDTELENPFRPVLDFFWTHYGKQATNLLPQINKMNNYCEHTYNWAFKNWKDEVYQEFEYNGKIVGAPVFIVTVFQSPSYGKKCSERETRSIWNQAWFSSLRSASGLFRYARRNHRDDLLEYALNTKELALSFKQEDGLFDSVIATDMKYVTVGVEDLWVSSGWDRAFTGNSNRNPFSVSIKTSPRHILDMSFTAYYMLIWYIELENDERLLKYATAYADRLLKLQFENGYYPAWIDKAGNPMQILDNSPETSMSIVFLLKLYKVTNEKKYLQSAIKAMKIIVNEIIPVGRWEDFETYWSCSSFWSDHVGKKILRNDMFKQCNFSMYFTAHALLEVYKVTNDRYYLNLGACVLDEMLMTQSSYQPVNIPIPVCGGFGVMNADAELNDARQSLFCELILEYGEILKNTEYIERGFAALRVSFSMMYCPQNPKAMEQWEKAWNFLTPKDYGFNMENYGHNGYINGEGGGIGQFTIYDWGNGAASENYQRLLDHGKIFCTDINRNFCLHQ